jgi:hypothetical protein
MNLAAKAIIASVHAVEPAQSDTGPVLGLVAAGHISDALHDAGYLVVHRSALQQLGNGMRDLLAIKQGK